MKKKKISVAVSGLNAIDSPGPGISVIRSLRESKYFDVRIIGLSYETLEPGLYMHDLVDKAYQLPLPSAGMDVLYARLQYINSIEKLDLIIPNFDAELFNFIKLAPKLKAELKINTFLPTLDQFEARHKVNLADFGKKHKIKVPKSKTIHTIKEVLALKSEFTYPLVVKGKFYDATVAYSVDQAISAFHKITSKWGLPIIIQEFVTGQEVNVTAIGDGKGNTMGAVPMRKMYITDKGKAWSGISIDDPKLLKMTTKLISSTKWKGGMELEIVKTEKEEYYLIEINPRFPAWVYLAVGCGQNHPEALVRMALKQDVKPFQKYVAGTLFVRYSYDMIVSLKEFETISTLGEL
ncbi:MAG: ATP-grasp domain-containing protein [Bacteroidia bacterium]|nr:ATP-grasp domain-containing protein [Bacteroidia bacterium]